MKPSEFNIPISVESCDKKTSENYRKGYVADKRIVSKILKISIPVLLAKIDRSQFLVASLSFILSEK